MDVDELQRLILSLPGARRTGRMETPDFCVGSKIFATLPSEAHLVLKLTLDQQQMLIRSDPAIFAPVDGAWGARGWTNAVIAALDRPAAMSAVMVAWSNAGRDGDRAARGDGDVRVGISS